MTIKGISSFPATTAEVRMLATSQWTPLKSQMKCSQTLLLLPSLIQSPLMMNYAQLIQLSTVIQYHHKNNHLYLYTEPWLWQILEKYPHFFLEKCLYVCTCKIFIHSVKFGHDMLKYFFSFCWPLNSLMFIRLLDELTLEHPSFIKIQPWHYMHWISWC